MTETVTVNPQHKDRLFRKLFNDKKELLSLYNAMNDTAYEEPALDVTCIMVNINQGHNKELMESCPLLGEYSRFISTIKEHILGKLSLEEAVRNAMDVCIRDGVLSEFLKQHREEAFHMILEEYNEELHKRTEAAYWKEVGIEEGIEIMKKALRLSEQGSTPEEIASQLEITADMVRQILE